MPPEVPPALVPATAVAAPWRLPAAAAFPLLALLLFAYFFAAAAPTPLFIVFQRAWGFSSSMLTVAFAIYALALLASLLVAGSLSDYVGRRPVMFVALLMQAVAMGMFLLADGIGGLIAARVMQGIATGIASGALSAAVIEAAPEARKRLGAMITSTSPLAGLAAGGLFTGIAVRYAAHPVELMFGMLGVVCVVGGVLALLVPETSTPRPGALGSLKPRVAVPRPARAAFLRAVPVFITCWSLCGLYMSLGPSLMLHRFGIDHGVVNGATLAVLAGMGALAPTLLARLMPAQAAVVGMGLVAVGLVVLLVSLATTSIWLFFAGTAVAGVGFGGGFSATLQTLAPLAPAQERARLFAAIFTVSYTAFSVPAMVAGRLIEPLGLATTTEGYLTILLALSLCGAWSQWAGARRP